MISRFLSGLTAVAVSLLVSLYPASAETMTLTDVLGRDVQIPVKAQRILLGFYFEDFYAIGGANAYDHVVAISRPTWQDWRSSQWDAYVAVNPKIAELADIGDVDSGTFSLESAIAAKPDLAILAEWQYTGLGDSVGKLTEAGIPVVVVDYNAQTVAKHVASTLVLGRILGADDRAKALADQYASAVADVVARIKNAGGEPKNVYVELGNKGADEYGNSYGNTMWGGVIGLAGGNNIANGKVENWGPLSPEYVIASNPDAVFFAGSDWTNKDKAVVMGFGVDPALTRSRMEPYTKRAGWSGIAAVQSGEVHAIYHGGARTLYDFAFMQYIAKALHPEAFADVDPVANLQQYYDTWLPIKADGVFMIKLAD